MNGLEPIQARPRSGDEPLHDRGRSLGVTLADFWRWSASDLVSNAMRGVLAEWLVALAVGCAAGARQEWTAYDLQSPEGARIEVKSAAYVQSWAQKKLSDIIFRVPKTRPWDPLTNQTAAEPRRLADVHVFCLLTCQDKSAVDPLNLDQWRFFVLPTKTLDQRQRSQHSITLPSLRKLAGEPVAHGELAARISHAFAQQRQAD